MKILIDRDGTFIEPAQTRTRISAIDGSKITIVNGLRPGRQVIESDAPPRLRMWWKNGAWVDKPPMSPIAPEDVESAKNEDQIREILKVMLATRNQASAPAASFMPADLAALALPDESLADLKVRLLTELTRLRSMAVGRLDMTDAERAMLTTLEGQVAQQWFSS